MLGLSFADSLLDFKLQAHTCKIGKGAMPSGVEGGAEGGAAP